MAYTFAEVFNMTNVTKSRNIEEAYKAPILNTAQNMIWRQFDWTWTLKKLNPFWLIPRIQDYGAPFVAVPTDFDGLRECRVAYISPGSDSLMRPLTIRKTIDLTGSLGVPSAITYQADQTAFRVYPRPDDSVSSPRYMINGTYKKTPTQLTVNNYQTTSIPSEDKFLEMWRKVINWAYLDFSADPRAGGIQIMPSGVPNYYGAYGEAFAAMHQAAAEEGLKLGDPMIAPSEPLLISGPWLPGQLL
jgi:hypothetical protein